MPGAFTPQDSFVYLLCFRQVPFYVGEGREAACVGNVVLSARDLSAEVEDLAFCQEVIAALSEHGAEFTGILLQDGMSAEEALRRKRAEAKRLRGDFLLANRQPNPRNVQQVLRGVLSATAVAPAGPVVAYQEFTPHFAAMAQCGAGLRQSKKFAAALQWLAPAAAALPEVGAVHAELGAALEALEKPAEAIVSYRTALDLEPENLTALHGLAGLLFEANELDEAIDLYEELARLAPHLAESFYDLGRVYKRRGDIDEAVANYARAILLRPDCFEFHFNQANAFFQGRRLVEAARAYRKAIELRPGDAEAHYSLGVTLYESGQMEPALNAYVQAIRHRATYAEAYSNLGVVCMELGDLGKAEECIRRALQLQPRSAHAQCNLGCLHFRRGEIAEATASFRTALECDAQHAESLTSLGFTLEAAGDNPGAVESYRRALEARPGYLRPRFFLGLHQMAEGNFEVGLPELELRWQIQEFRGQQRNYSQPQWRGEDLRGSRILLHPEQGFGDSMQFARYVPLLVERGAEVLLEVPANLHRLFRQSFESPSVRVLRTGDPVLGFDYHCPLMSLPLAFGTTLESVPANVPYLKADPMATSLWASSMPATKLRVGISWGGNPNHSRELQRAIALEQLAALTRVEGVAFYSLQKGAAAAQFAALGPDANIINLDEAQKDFADTAAIMQNLDLVISIDTSVAHLAGALGRPLWLMLHNNPDWRWLRERKDSPWYPTARLFRQATPGDWQSVLDELSAALAAKVAERG